MVYISLAVTNSTALANADKVTNNSCLANADKVTNNTAVKQEAIASERLMITFIEGMKKVLSVEDFAKFFTSMANFFNRMQFEAGIAVGILEGMTGGVRSTVLGIWDLLSIAVRVTDVIVHPTRYYTMAAIVGTLPYTKYSLQELIKLAQALEMPKELTDMLLTLEKVEAIAPILARILIELDNLAVLMRHVSGVLGSLLGQQIKEFLQSKPFDQGNLIGSLLGRAIYELVLLLVDLPKITKALSLGQILKKLPEFTSWIAKLIEKVGVPPVLKTLHHTLFTNQLMRPIRKMYDELGVVVVSEDLSIIGEPYKQLKEKTGAFKAFIKMVFDEVYDIEAHHIFEERTYEKFKSTYQRLGWNSKDEMGAIALEREAHRLGEEKLQKILGPTKRRIRSVTAELLYQAIGDLDKYENFEQLLNVCEKYYRGTAWSQSLERFFKAIRTKLELPDFEKAK